MYTNTLKQIIAHIEDDDLRTDAIAQYTILVNKLEKYEQGVTDTMSVKAITIVTAQGVREYVRGIDFDLATTAREPDGGTSYTLHKEDKEIAWIHPAVPIVVDYD